MDLLRALHIRDLHKRYNTLHDIGAVERTWSVLDAWSPTHGVFVYAPWIAVAGNGDVAVCVPEFEGVGFVLRAGGPVVEYE